MNVTIVEQSAKLLWITPNAAQNIELSGRVCYKSEDRITEDSAEKFVKMISDRGHESVIEHASASFLLTTDRGICMELTRHRLASYSQESTRYVNYNKRFGLQVVKPLGMTPVQEECWMDAMQTAANRYEEICSIQNCPTEVARDILPTCTKADIVVTANFREWKHIIRLRTSPKAHPKIRQLIGYVENTLIKECPAVFGKEKHAF
jgi:thymidylate synthase (FAD)